MRATRIGPPLTVILITALLIVANLSSRLSVHAQDVEEQSAPGALDNTFGNGGKVTSSFPGFQAAFGFDMAIQPDAKIVVGGEVQSNSADDFSVARYNTDG